MHYSDLLGYCAIRPGDPFGGYLLPLLPGSRTVESRAYDTPRLASPKYGPVNAAQGVRTPLLFCRTLCMSWFTPANLFRMFARNDNGALVGHDGDGSLGTVQWRHAIEGAIEFAAVKVSGLHLTWAAGEPLVCELSLAPYGFRKNAVSPFLAREAGRPWSWARVSHGAYNGVWSGALTVDNRLTAIKASPTASSLGFSVDGDLYPSDYVNDIYDVRLALEQAIGAYGIDPVASDGLFGHLIQFADPTGTRRVNVQLSTLAPDRTVTMRGGSGRAGRVYPGLKPGAMTPMLQFF